jgi:hypothetical protein
MKAIKTFSWCLSVALLGCGGSKKVTDSPPEAPQGEVVNAGTPQDDPAHPLLARFWMEVDPTKGHVTAYEIHPGNIIYRNQGVDVARSGLRYEYGDGSVPAQGGTGCAQYQSCVPPTGMVRLGTPQNRITYIRGTDGTCFSNNGPCDGSADHAPRPTEAPCSETDTFCADIELISNMPHPLPNLMLRMGSPGQSCGNMPFTIRNGSATPPAVPILGCQPNSTTRAHGLCQTAGNTKVDDPAGSNLASCITGDGVTTHPCTYCFGNAGAIDDLYGDRLDGLKHAVIRNIDQTYIDPTLVRANTIKVAIKLAGFFTVSFPAELRYTAPAVVSTPKQLVVVNPDPTGCVRPGLSDLRINGGGFGPPAACHGPQPLASCPLADTTSTTAPAAGYSVSLGGTPVTTGYRRWEDRSVQVAVPPGIAGTQLNATVTTPLGAVTTTSTVNRCAAPTLSSPDPFWIIGGGSGGCAIPGETVVALFGQSFGPPAGCYGSPPPATCPAEDTTSTTPPPNSFVRLGDRQLTTGYRRWSNGRVDVVVPHDMAAGYHAPSLTTSVGTVTSGPTVLVCAPGPRPMAPTGLTAVYATPPRINLAWTDRATNERGYRVYRSTTGAFELIAQLPVNTRTFTDLAFVPNVANSYRVVAYHIAIESLPSNVVTVTPNVGGPTNVTATVLSPSQVRINWSDGATGESGFHVERAPAPTGPWQRFTLPANTTSYTDSGLTPWTRYVYRVGAFWPGGVIHGTATPEVTTPGDCRSSPDGTSCSDGVTCNGSEICQANVCLPGTPLASCPDFSGDIQVSCTSTGQVCAPSHVRNIEVPVRSRIVVTFTPRATQCSSISVNLSVDGGPAVSTPFLAAAQSSGPMDLGIFLPGSHTLTVQGVGTPGGCNGGQLNAWEGNLAVTLYPFFACTANQDCNDQQPCTLDTCDPLRGCLFSGADTDGRTCGPGLLCSGGVCRSNVPTTPTILRAAIVSSSQVDLQWTDSTNETGYVAERMPAGATTWTPVPGCSVAANVLGCSDTSAPLTPGARVLYRVIASNSVGRAFSPPADAASACGLGIAPGTSCDDGSACTTDDTCQPQGCIGSVLSCDDGLVCSADSCDPSTGCQHTDVCTSASPQFTPISVTVFDRLGQPREGVEVTAFSAAGAVGPTVTTGASGGVVIPLPSGSYRFRAVSGYEEIWSGASPHCSPPGCRSMSLVFPEPPPESPPCQTPQECLVLAPPGPAVHVLGSRGDDLFHALRSAEDQSGWLSPFASVVSQAGAPWRSPLAANPVIEDLAAQTVGNDLHVLALLRADRCMPTPELPPPTPDDPRCIKTPTFSLYSTVRSPAGWTPFSRIHPAGDGIEFKSISLSGDGGSYMIFCGVTTTSVPLAAYSFRNGPWESPTDIYQLANIYPGAASEIDCKSEALKPWGRSAVAVVAGGQPLLTFLVSMNGTKVGVMQHTRGPEQPENRGFLNLATQLGIPAGDIQRIALAEPREMGDLHVVTLSSDGTRQHHARTRYPTNENWAPVQLIGGGQVPAVRDFTARAVGANLEVLNSAADDTLWSGRWQAGGSWSAFLPVLPPMTIGFNQVALVEQIDVPLRPDPATATMTPRGCAVELNWVDSDDIEEGYRIYVNRELRYTVPPLTNASGSFLVPSADLAPGRTHLFEISSFASDGESSRTTFEFAPGAPYTGELHVMTNQATTPRVLGGINRTVVSWSHVGGELSTTGYAEVWADEIDAAGMITNSRSSGRLSGHQTSFQFPWRGDTLNDVDVGRRPYRFQVYLGSNVTGCLTSSPPTFTRPSGGPVYMGGESPAASSSCCYGGDPEPGDE